METVYAGLVLSHIWKEGNRAAGDFRIEGTMCASMTYSGSRSIKNIHAIGEMRS